MKHYIHISNEFNIDCYAKKLYPLFYRSSASWLKVNPWGLRSLLRWIRDRYNNPPVYVTENGFGDNGGLHDMGRLNYYKSYTNEMLKGKNVVAGVYLFH
jgi:beta-glucosidase/6-phospho-beta-glucosidase/beta-galactosidase